MYIVHVDDDPVAHVLVRRARDRVAQQADLIAVDTLRSALSILSSVPVACLVTELALRDASGTDVARRLYGAQPGVPIVVLAAKQTTSGLGGLGVPVREWLAKGDADCEAVSAATDGARPAASPTSRPAMRSRTARVVLRRLRLHRMRPGHAPCAALVERGGGHRRRSCSRARRARARRPSRGRCTHSARRTPMVTQNRAPSPSSPRASSSATCAAPSPARNAIEPGCSSRPRVAPCSRRSAKRSRRCEAPAARARRR